MTSVSVLSSYQATTKGGLETLYPRSLLEKVASLAWKILSTVIFPLYCLRRYVMRNIVLPSQTIPKAKQTALNEWRSTTDRAHREYLSKFTHSECTVITPDGTPLHVTQMKDSSSEGKTLPTIIYFNSGSQTTDMCPFEELFQSLVIDKTVTQTYKPFNFVTFDYPGTGRSGGTVSNWSDLVKAGLSVTQWVNESCSDPMEIRFYGKALGGAVALDVRDLAQLNGFLCAERTFSSTDLFIEHTLLGGCGDTQFSSCVKRMAKLASRILGLSVNPYDIFLKKEKTSLALYHPEDPSLHAKSSLGNNILNNVTSEETPEHRKSVLLQMWNAKEGMDLSENPLLIDQLSLYQSCEAAPVLSVIRERLLN